MKELKQRLLKAKKFKFLRNIAIVIVSLIIVLFIVNTAPGYRRDKFTDVVNLIIDEDNKTEELIHNIYINENGSVYLSKEDIQNLFDSTIYYDEQYNQIITTGETKVANMVLDENKMTLNGSERQMIDDVIKIDDNIYLPIYDLTLIYNINVKYVPSTNKVIIENLNKGIISAMAAEETNIKFRPRRLSKDIGTLKEGETVYCFYTTSKGWRKIRTQDGTLGYIKANKLTSEYIIRQDMEKRGEAIIIARSNYSSEKIIINNEKIDVKNIIYNYEDEAQDDNEMSNNAKNKKWGVVKNTLLEKQISTTLKDYKTRTELIDSLVNKASKNDLKGLIIDFSKINDSLAMQRFIIELTPKLREIGINTCLVLNENMQKDDYINIVDYVIE